MITEIKKPKSWPRKKILAEKRPLIDQLQWSLSKIKTAATPAPSIGQKFKLTSKKATSDMKGSVTIRFVALNTSSYSTLLANSTTEFPSGRRNIINTVYRLEEHCKLKIRKIKKLVKWLRVVCGGVWRNLSVFGNILFNLYCQSAIGLRNTAN